jgi:hypothetical protein
MEFPSNAITDGKDIEVVADGGKELAGLEFEDAEVFFALEHDVELAVEAVAR